jgi:hypothetical protein
MLEEPALKTAMSLLISFPPVTAAAGSSRPVVYIPAVAPQSRRCGLSPFLIEDRAVVCYKTKFHLRIDKGGR